MNKECKLKNNERYMSIKMIGKGRYGEVYKAYDKEKDMLVAIKVMNVEFQKNGLPINVLREIVIFKGVKH